MNVLRRGHWLLRIYPWHSINLWPMADTMSVCDDDGRICARMLSLGVLGWCVVVQWPSTRWELAHEWIKPRGPSWSRRRRAWYSIDHHSS